MKYINFKTLTILLSASAVMVLTGCGSEGVPSDYRLVGSADTGGGTPVPPENMPPVADAGVDQTVTEGAAVTLDGSASSDPDGTIVSYEWKEGAAVMSTAVNFTKSDFAVGIHTVTLTVTDDDGATAIDSATVTVNAVPNQPPVADAGVDQTVTEGAVVTLDGSASSDPDGTIVSYEWKEGAAVLSTAVSFTKSDFTVGSHIVTLTITDDDGATATDDVNVTVRGSCWVTLSDPVLDINQSQDAELPTMIVDRDTAMQYVAWTEGEWGEAYYHVKSFDSTSGTWNTLGDKINTRKATGWPRAVIKLDPTDYNPYIYYYEDNGTFDRGHIVKKWNGSSWNSVYEDSNFGPGAYTMDVNQSNGNIILAYRYGSNVLYFKLADGTDAFNRLDQHSQIYTPTLLVNGHKPYVVYYYSNNYTHSNVRDYNGTDWASLGSLESNTSERVTACDSSIIDSNDNLVVAYVEKGDPRHGSIPATVNVKRYNGTNWELIGDAINGSSTVDTSSGMEDAASDRRCVSLTEAGDGSLYVAWQNEEGGQRSIYTNKYDGANWSEAAKPLSDDQKLRSPSLIIDSDGRMNISVMYDSTPGNTDSDDVKVYRCEP